MKSPLKIVIIDFRPIKIHHIFEKISHFKIFINFIYVTLFLFLIIYVGTPNLLIKGSAQIDFTGLLTIRHVIGYVSLIS